MPYSYKEKILNNLKHLKVEIDYDGCVELFANGYYNRNTPDTLYYKGDSVNIKEVVTHEFIHLTQHGENHFLKETFAYLQQIIKFVL